MIKIQYANSHDGNMYYEINTFITDRHFFFDINGKKFIFLDSREIEAFKKKNKNKNVKAVLLEPFIEKAQKMDCDNKFKLLWRLFLDYNIAGKEVFVSNEFPLDFADFLRSRGVELKILSPFTKERERKKENEINAIKKSINKTEKAFDFIIGILKKSDIKNNKIYFKNNILTSEFLKREVEKFFIDNEMSLPEGMIISSGEQSAIPHHTGEGALKPHKPIICDIFPKDKNTGYFADLTRTFFKGEPVAELVKMYDAVKKTQEESMNAVAPGKNSKDIYKVSVESFLKLDYHVKGKGFIHGTGHGFGLDIHEEPYLNAYSDYILKEGSIITIEPGLYYPKIGGIRIEDDVLITKNGFECLSGFTRELLVF